jgi:hypothetical protein
MSDKIKNVSSQSVEQRILIVMRKVLATVVKEVTPPPGMRHPLSEQTIDDIKNCFSLIAARERELQSEIGQVSTNKPVYPGQTSTAQIVEFDASIKPDSEHTPEK